MGQRRLLGLIGFVALLVLAGAPGIAGAANALRVVIGRPMAAHGSFAYPITVLAEGTPVVAILPYETLHASLEVDGVVVQSVGRDQFMGHQPLAHSGASLLLSNLLPKERVVLRLRGTREPPRIVTESGVLTAVYGTGVGTGILYGLLVTAVLMQIVAMAGYREWANLWYIGVLLVMLGVESVRNDVWHLDMQRAPIVLGACAITSGFIMVGFTATYLRLYVHARRLLWFIIAANLVPGPVSGVLQALGVMPVTDVSLFAPAFIGNAALIIVAALRWRAGFKPALLLLSGLFALCTYYAIRIAVDLSGASFPFFDWWGFEIAMAFDVLLFSLGIAYRDRFSKRVQSEIERELRDATFSAGHDALTGLLNRRGLEAWIAAQPKLVATLLYLDIDGFKAVNDRGGHAAGDDTLRVVARIIRHAVREGDQFARMGGDEFLAVLLDVSDRNTATDVIARITSAVAFLRPLGSADDRTRIGISIGLGHIAGARAFPEALREADADLYRRKSEHQALARKRRLSPGHR